MIELQVVNVPILPRIISSFLIVTLVYITILQKAGVFTICLRGGQYCAYDSVNQTTAIAICLGVSVAIDRS